MNHTSDTVEDKLLRVSDACNLLSYSRATLYRLVQQKQIPFVRVGGTIRFRYRSLLEWMKDRETQPEQAASPPAQSDLLIPCGQEPLR